MRSILQYGLICLIFVIVTGCNQASELPTIVPTIIAPSPQSSSTESASATPRPTETVPTITPSQTPVVLEARPTSVVGSGVNITLPDKGQTIYQGYQVEVSGLVQMFEGDKLDISLVAASGVSLATADIEVSRFNSWRGSLDIPYAIGGFAEIQAIVRDHDGNEVASDKVPVFVFNDPERTDRYLELFRPTTESIAVAGYHLFFDGIAKLPVNNVVVISARNESCQNEIARQSFRLRGSGYWQGFLPLPVDTVGQICAIAHFGTPGDSEWREVQIPINVIAKDDEGANSITVGNPPPESSLDPGKSILFYGTAFNAQENQILVSVLLENGRLLTESIAIVDYFGYWEVELYIEAEASGPAYVEASYGERGSDDFVNQKIAITIGSPE